MSNSVKMVTIRFTANTPGQQAVVFSNVVKDNEGRRVEYKFSETQREYSVEESVATKCLAVLDDQPVQSWKYNNPWSLVI